MNREENPCRDFIEAVDVKGEYLYRRDGYIISYLRILPFNLDLLSDAEKTALAENITSKIKTNRKDFVYVSFPREVDLDSYKKHIKEMHRQQTEIGRKTILSYMMKQANDLTLGGNYEHQHFLRIWEKNSKRETAEENVKERINLFKSIYEENGIKCEILSEKEIVKLCNLFGNALQANFEKTPDNAQYTPIMWID